MRDLWVSSTPLRNGGGTSVKGCAADGGSWERTQGKGASVQETHPLNQREA